MARSISATAELCEILIPTLSAIVLEILQDATKKGVGRDAVWMAELRDTSSKKQFGRNLLLCIYSVGRKPWQWT